MQDVAREDDLSPPPCRTARSKAVSDDRRVPEERVLHAGLPMIARRLLPASPPTSSMFHSSPFTLAHDRESRAVDEEMQAGTCGGATQRKIEMLATP